MPWLKGCIDEDSGETASTNESNRSETIGTRPADHVDSSDPPPVQSITITSQVKSESNDSEETTNTAKNCNALSTTECLEYSHCQRSRRKMDNGIWIGVCTYREDHDEEEAADVTTKATMTTTEATTTVQATSVPTGEPTVSMETESPTLQPSTQPTSSPSETTAWTSSNAPTISTADDASTSTTTSTTTTTSSTDPSLYCAHNFDELQSQCHTAPRCNHTPCPSGMFCFPHECQVEQQEGQVVVHSSSSVAESIVNAAMEGALNDNDPPTMVPTFHPTMSPMDTPVTEMPTPIPTTEAPMTPSSSPTYSPSRPYSTSDFIVELIEWSNVNIDTDHINSNSDGNNIQFMSSKNNLERRTFAPTPHPSAPPSQSPTLHPMSSSPTLHPTPHPIPTMELILPSLGETTISSSRPNDNFGSLEAIAVTSGNLNTNSDRFDSLLLFDVSLLDPTMDIMYAGLKMYNMNSCSGGSKIYLTAPSGSWDELIVNWNTAPQAQGVAIGEVNRMYAKSWSEVDITEAISVWNSKYHSNTENGKLLSLRIMSLKDSLCMFAGGVELRPRIVVRYAVAGVSGGGGIQMMSGSYNGAMYDAPMTQEDTTTSTTTTTTTASNQETILVQQTTEQTILATADASLSNIRQFQNFGTQNAIVVDGGDYASGLIRGSNEEAEKFDALIKFDLSSLVQSNIKHVEDVVLRIHVTKGCESGGNVFMTESSYSDWDQDTVTWKDAPRTMGGSIGNLGRVEASEWYNVDLSNIDIFSSSSSNNILTLRISSKENTRCMYTSVDRGNETAPRLIVKIRSLVPQAAAAVVQSASMTLRPTQDLIPTTGNFILIVATDDATIDATRPNAIQGDHIHLFVDYNERSRVIRDTLIRFDLSQMQGGRGDNNLLPRSALLTLFTESRCENAGTFMSTEGGGDWTEDDVIWTTAPTFLDNGSYEGGHMVGTFGAVDSGRWYGFSVVDALIEAVLMRKTTITFRLTSGRMQSCSFSSIQSGRPPKILVAF